MPFVRGFLKVGRRGRPGRPDISLPDEGEDMTPDWGIEEGELPEVEPPDPPPGIWPPLTPEQPWRPIPGRPPVVGGGPARPERPTDPGFGIEEGGVGQLPELPPGTIWPPLPPGVHGKFLALVLIGSGRGVRYRYVVVDAGLRPGHPLPGHPDTGGPAPPTPQPKR